MPDHALFNVRALLILQIMLISLMPEIGYRLHQEMISLRKKLRAFIITPPSAGKKNRFREIDMTKFEP